MSQINQNGISDKQTRNSERIMSTNTEAEESDSSAVIAELEGELQSVRDSLRMQTRLAKNASGFQVSTLIQAGKIRVRSGGRDL